MSDDTMPHWVQDKYLIRQKLLAINERYTIRDGEGNDLLFVRRPALILRNLLTVATFIGGLIAAVLVGMFVASAAHPAVGIVAGILVFVVAVVVAIAIMPYRHITICTDPDYRTPVLTISQDNKVHPLIQRFSLRAGDNEGPVLARFRKNILWNAFRRRWQIMSSDSTIVALAMEDSVLMSLLRRTVGQYLPFFRTNFIYVRNDDRSLLGLFNRKFTVRDNYLLDLTHDADRTLDRRVALAMGVLLDTGERR